LVLRRLLLLSGREGQEEEGGESEPIGHLAGCEAGWGASMIVVARCRPSASQRPSISEGRAGTWRVVV
jgi:hypothetical protein